ncbi:retinal cone rhodopsin-sensitive cGMP 3',5'-cyclic phosphodiesterase subunit gamma-like [Mastacembelus armatus]|uniref:retinal cone rhodopsin-sensitive cGMP 3',5'-cyclic phosphodiesterase subunit gamma-like n=1 Tax=Mastacembelus armatus TaxID=205130 RepID=UPI000E46331B|nr:retinal cone rhodopsin-sensitive cGMP 3',5'-cyclic phosphodiesterase subunit gamma-like [Mastacembelus armatus]
MNLDVAICDVKTGSKAPLRATGPRSPHKGPHKFKQRNSLQFKNKSPKRGVTGFGDDIPGMEGLGTDITVICPWEVYSHLELHELVLSESCQCEILYIYHCGKFSNNPKSF